LILRNTIGEMASRRIGAQAGESLDDVQPFLNDRASLTASVGELGIAWKPPFCSDEAASRACYPIVA
jgi:hypothetical protein